jgi:hypothetical protein
MDNLTENLNAIDPQYEGQLSPRQLIAQQQYQRATSPYEFFQAKYTPFQNANIEDNSQLIGKTSLDSQNSAMAMQQSGADQMQSTLRRGRLGGAFDNAKNAVKQFISHGAPMKSEGQIHAGINSQDGGANPAFAGAPDMGGLPTSNPTTAAVKSAAPSSGGSVTPAFTEEHLNPPNAQGIRTFTDKGNDYINGLADTYHKANNAINNPFGIQGKLNHYQDEAESYFK